MSLRYAILGLLVREELSGYEITKRFEESVGYFWFAHAQQIYPELARLEREGLATSRPVRQRGRPDKRVYRATARGLQALREWVTTPSPPTLVKDEFLVKVYNYGVASPEAALGAIREHRRRHEERLATYRAIEALFGGVTPSDLPNEAFGPYLTLLAGMRLEAALLGWFDEVERVLAERAARQLAGGEGAATSASRRSAPPGDDE